MNETTPGLSRRRVLQSGGAGAGGLMLAGCASTDPPLVSSASPRDHFWLWCHAAESHNRDWGLPKPSRITPVEAAHYMGIPNTIMVRYEGDPEPPFDRYAVPFRSLREVVWSVVGAAGATDDEEREGVLQLARGEANFSGVMMDDFFTTGEDRRQPALSVEELEALQGKLKSGSKPLDLWVVLYDHQLGDPVGLHLARCDVVTYWTWEANGLDALAENFARAEELAPKARKVLGCYMWDYGTKQPMPISKMEAQCEQGLAWLREGRIDGMIFLASCICDLELETVEWTREWIGRQGAV